MSSCHFSGTSVLVMILTLLSPISTIADFCSDSFRHPAITMIRNFTSCKRLNTLGVEFGWNFHNETSSIDVYVGAKMEYSKDRWLAWGVNPLDRPQMVGTRALIGIKHSNGSTSINTYNITRETKLGCRLRPSEIDVEVRDMKFQYLSEIEYYTIYATIVLPQLYKITRLNLVWQVGSKTNGMDEPLMHQTTLENMDSTETIDLVTGSSHGVTAHLRHMRIIHGIFNIVGWGMFLPIGVIISRYFNRFPIPYVHWLNLHKSFQTIGYMIGTIGWIFGLWLGHSSKCYSFHKHGTMGTFIFSFTTIQMMALVLRPYHPSLFWNMYHHFLGYGLLALISVNIFKGIDIFTPNHRWKWAYIGLLLALASTTLAMEIYTWFKFLLKPHKKQKDRAPVQSQEEKSEPQTTTAK